MESIERNKKVVRKLYEEALNQKKLEILPEIFAAEYVPDGPPGNKGAAGFEAVITPLLKAFPDIQYKLLDLVGEEDRVAVRWILQGTHEAAFANFSPTGKKISNEGMAIFTIRNGKIVQSKLQTDRLGFLQEMKVLPVDLKLLNNKLAHKDNVSFIDKFFVPAASIQEFNERVRINRELIKKLPGFLDDGAWQYKDDSGNLILITIAHWESADALKKAKETVQAAYKAEGFDAAAMLKRLNIVADRGVYTQIPN